MKWQNIGAAVLYLLTTCAIAATPVSGHKSASPATLAAQAQMQASLPVDTGQDDEFAHRGFIATAKDPVIRAEDGHIAWDMAAYDWIKGDAPPTVNPSLWRQMKFHKIHGLFKVADGLWQVRGFDGSNMTVVNGKTGWVIIDPLWSKETAAAAIKLVNEQLGTRPVTGVIYSHSHPDHFGGVRGIVDSNAPPPIFAPEHFMQETSSEWVMVGNATGRRAAYHIGALVPLGPQDSVGTGLSGTVSTGAITLIAPSDSIKQTGETRDIDGVKIEFQMVPDTEAPSEMNLYLPDYRTFFIAEIATCTMHNIQTPRGALVRDALRWAGFLTEALTLYGERSDNIISGHCWPRFGNDVVKNYLALQRDNYKFIHDQTVRMMNMGETPTEIAEQLKPPPAITNEWSNHGYYGTYRHNAKGVYQRYIGWWDGNPAHLNMYPPVEQGKRYVAAMGGAKNVIRVANEAMKTGDYRWSAELLNHLVFADPNNKTAKDLLADSYEQMGYQAESAVWRNYYISGAAELRQGILHRVFMGKPHPDLINAMPTASFLDMVATRLNPTKIGDRALTIALAVTDRNEHYVLSLKNAVLVSEADKSVAAPTVTLSGNRPLLMGLFVAKAPLEKMEAAGLKVGGDRAALTALLDAIETPPPDYPIVTP